MNLRTISADKLRSLGLVTYQGLSAIADERGFGRWLAVIAKKGSLISASFSSATFVERVSLFVRDPLGGSLT